MVHAYFIDNQLYLDFLEIPESNIPTKNDSINKQELFKIIETQFRALARKYHPDYGGTDQEFNFLTNCKNKLLESNYSNNNAVIDLCFSV